VRKTKETTEETPSFDRSKWFYDKKKGWTHTGDECLSLQHPFIEPDLQTIVLPIKGLTPDPRQARTHGDRSIEAIKSSLYAYGQKKPIVVTTEGVVVAGHGTIEAARALGRTHIAAVTSGDSDKSLRAFAIQDNRTAELSDWDNASLQTELAALADLGTDLADIGWYEDEYQALISGDALEDGGNNPGDSGDNQNPYTRNITAPIYTPTGEKPKISDLFDSEKTRALIRKIGASDIPQDEKEFLKVAARRHTVFNYHKIADYYAQSEPEVQRLMEDSALVIIDFNRAIELGYVKLTDEIAAQYNADYPGEESDGDEDDA